MVFSFLVGFYPAFWFVKDTYRKESQKFGFEIFLLSVTLGFLLLGFVSFNVSILSKAPFSAVAGPTVGCLTGLSLMLALVSAERRAYLRHLISRGIWIPGLVFLAGLPLAAFHILLPLWKQNILMSYALGNDGAAYFGAIESLQTTFWEINKGAVGLVIARPCMQYLMALSTALFGVPTHFSYSATSAVVATCIASLLTLIYLGLYSTRTASNLKKSLVFVTSAFVIGFIGCYPSLYYAGTMSQYFGALPVFYMLTFFFVEPTWIKRIVWFSLAFSLVITMYTIGFVLVPLFLVALYYLVESFEAIKTDGFRKCAVSLSKPAAAMAIALAISFVFYGYELQFIFQWVGTRNLATNTSKLLTAMIDFGLTSRYSGHGDWQERVLGFCLVLLGLVSLLHLRRMKPAAMVLWLAPVVVTVVLLAVDKRNLYLTKYGCILLPLFTLSALAVFDVSKSRLLTVSRVLALIAVFYMGGQGYTLTRYFFMEMSKARTLYVDPKMVAMKKTLFDGAGRGSKVLAVDYTSERHTFLRAFLRPMQWQPVRNQAMWDEFGMTPARYPKEFDDYKYDYLLVADDMASPVDQRAGNEKFLVSQPNEVIAVYGAGASLLDLDLSFEMNKVSPIPGKPGFSKFDVLSKAPEATLRFVNRGRHTRLKVSFEPVDAQTKVEVRWNNRLVPESEMVRGAGLLRELTLDCKGACLEGVSKLTFNQKGQGLILTDASFSY